MIRRALIPLFLPLAAFADDPFACVDPDVVDAFVGGWHESARYSTEVPPEIASGGCRRCLQRALLGDLDSAGGLSQRSLFRDFRDGIVELAGAKHSRRQNSCHNV